MAKKNSIGKSCGGCLVLIVLVGFGMSYMRGCVDRGFVAVEKQREQDVIVEQELDAEKPLGTEERLRHEITDAVGTSNRNVQKISRLDVDGGRVSLVIAFDDNLTEGFIRGSMRQDIVAVLKAADESGYDFSEIEVAGSFPLVDKFGNSTESIVAKTSFSRGTVERINWDNFISDNLFEIADSAWLHPAMQEK